MGKKIVGGIVTGIVIIVALVLFFKSTETIDRGYEGVVWSQSSGTQQQTLGEGWHVISPVSRVTAYPVSTETVKVPKFSVQTKDGKPVQVSLGYNYHNDAKKLPQIYKTFRGQRPENIESSFLQMRLRNAVLDTFSSYSVLEVFQGQGKIRQEIFNKFEKSVSDEGFIIEEISMGSPAPDAQTQRAIQSVVDAQQKLEKAKVDLQQTKMEAQQQVEKAQGEAQSKQIAAQAEAKANETINDSLNKDLIQYKSIEKWNGSLPTVTGGSTPFINLK